MYRTRRSTRVSATPAVVSENGANSSDTSTVASPAQTSSLSSSGPATSAPVASTRRSTGRAAAATATNASNATVSTSTGSSGSSSSSTLLVSSGGVEDTTVRGQSIEDNNVVIANSTSQQTHQQQGSIGSRSSRTRRGSSSSTTQQLRRSERGAGGSSACAAQVIVSPQAGQQKDNANQNHHQRNISEPSTTTSSNAIGMTTASDGDKAVATTAVTNNNNSSNNSETAGQEQIEKTFCADTNTSQVRNGSNSNKSADSAAEDEADSNTNLLVSPKIGSVVDTAVTNSTTATADAPATSTSLARSIAILEIEKSILKGDIFKAKTQEPEDELSSLPPIVLVDGSTGLPLGGSAGIAAGDVKDTSGTSDSSSVGSCEEESSPKQSSTFYLTVTDEGSVYFNPTTPDGQVIEEGETFPVNLPTHKIKSPTNPLPGLAPVTTSGRSRKTKPQAVTYGGETHVGFLDPTGQAVIKDGNFVTMEIGQGIVSQFSGQSTTKNRHSTSSVVMTLSTTPQQLIRPTDVSSSSSTIVSLEVPATSIDVSEFESHLDPQSIAVLENVLQSDQGREILTEALGEMGVVPDSAGQEQQLWDHSYTPGGKLGKDEAVVSSSSVSVCSGVSAVVSDSPSSTTQMNTEFEGSTPGYRGNGGRLSGRLSSSASISSPRGGKGSVPVARNISESDSANIRRSQRQQDRIERQEAERILAENQQMLQREKEIMAKALTVSSPVTPVTPQPPVNVGIVSSTQTTTSTPSVPAPVPSPVVIPVVPEVPRATPVVDSTTRLSASTVEKLDDSNVRRPIRNRKLPAHLADPNYLSLEDATTAVKEATRRLSTTQETVQQVEEITPLQEEVSEEQEDETKEEVADEYTEDDPNRLWCICRQPHNNRFMICCDRCEDWFHGKCVNVTKSQGKAMEIKNIPWHCPDCKKNIAAERKAEVQVVVTQKQVKQQQQQLVLSEKTGRGRKSETQTSPKLVSAKTAKAAAAVAAQKAESEAAAVTALSAEPPSKIAAAAANKRGRRKSEKGEVEEPPLTTNCVICKKPARSGSIYCSDTCVQKYAQTVGSKNSSSPSSQDKSPAPASPVTPSQASPSLDHNSPTSVTSTVTKSPTVVNTTPSKLKRSHSKPEVGLGLDPIFNFHVINPGASVSTEVVPQKPKEITASALLKAQKERNAAVGTTVSLVKPTSPQVVSNQQISLTPIPVVQGISPNSVSAIVNSSPTVVMRKVDASDGGNNKGMMMNASASDTNYIEQEATFVSCVVDSKEKHERHRTSSLSDSKISKSSSSISSSSTTSRTRTDSTSRPKERERERRDSQKETKMDGPPSEKLHRENMRKSLKEILKNRIADMSSGNKKKMDAAGNSADIVSAKIEEELVTCYGGANNTKCKNKYRSIYFNLKDEKNSLFQEILLGNIKAYDLVRMTPEQMAPSELAQWRQQEKEKELDAIKRAELDKLAEAKKQELLDKGVEDAVQVAEESKPLDISDVIDVDAEGKRLSSGDKDLSTRDRTSSHHHHHRHHDKKELRSRDHDKSRDRDDKSDKDKSKGDKDKHRHDKERDREKDRKSDRHSSSSTDRGSRHKSSGLSDKKSHHEKERESRDKEKDKKDRDKDKDRRSDRHKHRDNKERESSSKVKHASSKDSKNVSERRHERLKEIDKEKDRRHQSGKSQSPKATDSVGSGDIKSEELDSIGQGFYADVPVSSSSNNSTTPESTLMAKSPVGNATVIAASAAVTTTDTDQATSSITVQESQISDNKPIVKEEVRHSIDSEQELPSSTIKTPDFTEDSSNGVKREEADHVFQSTLLMPELGEFKASFYNVSHSEKLKGLCFPESPVPIVGRIGPQTVWDYIDKMKKTKEIITFRLTPASPADAKGYMSFFTYLSSRERLGVIGGISHPLKDVYLIPLDKHQPVPRCLLPFRGPGLPKERTHCLLAVVTRHTPNDGSLKRKLSTTDPAGAKKRAKGESMKLTRNKGNKTTDRPIGKAPKALSPPKLETETEREDENEPYTPWDEDEKSEVVPDAAVPSSSASTPLLPAPSPSGSAVIIETQKQLQEIEAQIAKQKEDIVSILQGAAKNVVGIPGLDGDFPESLPEDNAVESQEKEDVPIFLRPTPVLSSLDPRSTRSSIFKHQQPTVVTKAPTTTIPGLDLEIRDSCEDDVVVIEQKENPRSHLIQKPIAEVVVDSPPKKVEEEEAYSPSAMDFSDDDVLCDDDIVSETRKIADDKPVKDNKTGGRFMFGQQSSDTVDEEKIETKHAESQSKEPLIVDLDERQTQEIKIILSKINIPVVPIAHSTEQHAGLQNKSLDGIVDLVDDSEPPPPGESPPSLPPLCASPLTKSNKVFDDSPFEKSPLLTNNQSRVKININLSTKMLPLSARKKEIDNSAASFVADSSEPSLGTIDCPVEPTMFKDIDERILAKESLPPIIPETIPLPPVDFKTVPPPVVMNQPLTTLVPSVPLHIPPPTLPSSSSGSVVINLNVPPPPFINIPPPPTGIRFPSPQTSSAQPQQVAAPNFLSRPPPSTPPRNQFSPIDTSSSSGRQSRPGPGPHSKLFNSMSSSPKEAEDRGMSDKDKDDRSYLTRQDTGRGSYSQDRRRAHDRVERVKRNRSRSKSRDRSRSRSRSRSRDRKRRRRHSRSRSPVRRSSRRNRSRSRSRSPVL